MAVAFTIFFKGSMLRWAESMGFWSWLLGFCVWGAWGFGVEGFRLWEFPKIRVLYFGVLIIRILLFRVL